MRKPSAPGSARFLLEGTLQVRHARRGKLISRFKAIGIFLFSGAAMASMAGATLIWRGSALDRLWALYAHAYRQLAPFGSEADVAFLLLGALLVIAGRGWFLRPFWGWGLAAVLVASQAVGSAVNAVLGDFWEGTTGSILAGAILYFLLRPQMRTAFRKKVSPEHRLT